VIKWQQVGQPTSAVATPHCNDRTSTKRPAITAAVAMGGHMRWDLDVRLRPRVPRAYPAEE